MATTSGKLRRCTEKPSGRAIVTSSSNSSSSSSNVIGIFLLTAAVWCTCCLIQCAAAEASFSPLLRDVASSHQNAIASDVDVTSLSEKPRRLTYGIIDNLSYALPLNRHRRGANKVMNDDQLRQSNKSDMDRMLDSLQHSRPSCTTSSSDAQQSQANFALPTATMSSLFRPQLHMAVHVANTVSSILHVRGNVAAITSDDEAVFYSLVKSAVASDAALLGCGIFVFEPPVRMKVASSAATAAQSSSSSSSSSAKESSSLSFAPWADKLSAANDVVYVRDLSSQTSSSTSSGSRYAHASRLIQDHVLSVAQQQALNDNQLHGSSLLNNAAKVCNSSNGGGGGSNRGRTLTADIKSRINNTYLQTPERVATWQGPLYNCSMAPAWVVAVFVPFFACDSAGQPPITVKGVVAAYINVDKVDINQCEGNESPFAGTHHCPSATTCRPKKGHGFKRGGYECACPPYGQLTTSAASYAGLLVERAYLRHQHGNQSQPTYDSLRCPCPVDCADCFDDVINAHCLIDRDVIVGIMPLVPLVIQVVCMVGCTALGVLTLRLRRVKVMKAAVWPMLEVVLMGALLLYSSVIVLYFEPSPVTCSLGNWAREIGFVFMYGALVVKLYKVLAEFQSRKARRVIIGDWELLRYMCGLAVVAVVYMGAWLAVNVDYVSDGGSMVDYGQTADGLIYPACRLRWWSFAVQAGEFVFLCFAIYVCHRVRSAPTDYRETRYISWAIYNETLDSTVVHIISHFLWLRVHPDFIFIVYFLRCQVTVTVNLLLIFGPKLWYVSHPPRADMRSRPSSAALPSDTHDNALPAETVKLRMTNPNGDVDVSEINISEMDSEDIRSELKRVYTQLHVYRTKTMHKDNPHISKKRGGKRNQAPRRFSLQAFHHRHKRDHAHGHGHGACGEPSFSEANEATEVSRTPEESTNSAEGLGYSIAEEASSYCTERPDGAVSVSSGRTPTVTFKPGHTSIT